MRELIIGIDGGGTKTNLVAVDIQTGLIAATSTVGSIHISTQGEAAALRHLELGIAELGLGSADRVAAVSIGDPAIDDCDGDAFGTGHSHMLAEELFYRAGGLVKVYPILDEPLMLHKNASRSSQVERLSGYAATLLGNGISPTGKDTAFIFSNSGRNAVPVEMALEMKQRGVCTICITNLAQSSRSVSRHASGLRLFELCDIVIDNCGCDGDAAMEIGNYRCGPTSTVIGVAVLQAIVCGVAARLQECGMMPEIFCSSNVDGGDALNHVLIERYRQEIPML